MLQREVHVAWSDLWHLQGSHIAAAIRGVSDFIAAHRCRRPVPGFAGPSLRMGSKWHIESLTRPRWLHKSRWRDNSWYLRQSQGPGLEKPCLCCREGHPNVSVYAMPRCHAFRLWPRPPCVVRNPHHEALAFPSLIQPEKNIPYNTIK